MLTTRDFPQANTLEKVIKATEFIAEGERSDLEIGRFIGGNPDRKPEAIARDGRYYREATELMGLVVTDNNTSSLTSNGQEFVSLLSEVDKKDYMAKCIVETPVFQSALKYISESAPTQAEFNKWIAGIYPGEESTANRRRSTIQNYLLDAGLVRRENNEFKIVKFVGGLTALTSTKFKTLGTTFQIGALPTAPNNSGVLKSSYELDIQKTERAKLVHWKLIDGKAKALIQMGIEPTTLGPIDLFAKTDSEVVFYEMKSITPDSGNFQPQIRKAISQLYEYRYLAKEPNAKLSIVASSKIPPDLSWMETYLPEDRKIAFEWTSDFEKFHTEESSKKLLGDLSTP